MCLGGALTAITAAYLIQTGDDRVGAITLLNTMLDYAEPGQLGVFTDEAGVDKLEKEMSSAERCPASRWPEHSTCCAPTT